MLFQVFQDIVRDLHTKYPDHSTMPAGIAETIVQLSKAIDATADTVRGYAALSSAHQILEVCSLMRTISSHESYNTFPPQQTSN